MRPPDSVVDVQSATLERARLADDALSLLRVIAAGALIATLPLTAQGAPWQLATIVALATAALGYALTVAIIRPHRRWPGAAAVVLTALDAAFATAAIILTGGIASPYATIPVVALAAASFRFGAKGVAWATAGHALIPVAVAAASGFGPAAVAYLAINIPLLVFLGAFLALLSRTLLPAQQGVLASEERFRLAVSATHDGIWDWNLRTNEVYFSPRCKEMLGYADDEIASSWEVWGANVHPDDRARVLATLADHVRHGAPLGDVEYRLRHKDGTWRWVLSRAASQRDAEGRVERIAGSLADVTARRAAEEKLRELKQLHEDIVENVPAGVAYLDANGLITHENRYLLRVLGARPDDPPRGWMQNILDLDTVRARPEFATRVRQLLAGEAFHEFEFEYRSLYGRDLVLSASGVPIEGADMPRRGAILLVRDITEARRAEEQRRVAADRLQEIRRLEEMNRFKTQLLNTASHELNTPLTPLRLQTHLLKSGALGQLNERQHKSIGILDRNLDRLSSLVGDVLDVARIQAGRLRLRPEPLELATLVAHATEAFEEPAEARGIRLVVDARGPIPVQGDPARLTQVLFNLIANALRFTGEGGVVRVDVREEGDLARVRIADSGIGLERTQITRLFQPFSQVHEEPRGGTGLGLYISKGILAEHGGQIGCESAGTGRGATFWFDLPLAGGPAAEPVALRAVQR